MEACMHFLGQVNSGDFVVWKADENFFPVSRENCGDPDSRKAVMKKLREDIFALLEQLSPDTPLVLFFENGFSLHTFCQGLLLRKALSYPEIKTLVDDVAQDDRLSGYTVRWFYPYPGIDRTTHLFSDERLPHSSECEDPFDNFGYAVTESFDEPAATDRIVSAGLYRQMANAYMVVFLPQGAPAYPDFCKFSMQRREDRQIMTLLQGERAEKCALCLQAADHVLAMAEWEKRLAALTDGLTVFDRPLRVNRILSTDEDRCAVQFAYADGQSMETILDNMLAEGRDDEVELALLTFSDEIRNKADRPFVTNAGFWELFGGTGNGILKNCMSLEVTDIDLVCQNIIVGDREAVLIDYEWTFDFPVPVDFVIYRFLYLYLEAKDRCPLAKERTEQLYEKAGISPALREKCEEMETRFQQYVQDGAYVLRNVYEAKGSPVLRERAIRRMLDRMESRIIAVTDEEGTVFLPGKAAEENHTVMHYRAEINGESDRISLAMKGFGGQALIRLGLLLAEGDTRRGADFETNGQYMGGQVYFFEQEPVITVQIPGGDVSELLLSVEEIGCSQDALGELKARMEELDFLYHNREEQLAMMQDSVSWKVTAPLRKMKKENSSI